MTAERPDEAPTTLLGRALRLARVQWPIFAVLAVFLGTTFIVPTLAPAWVADDWLYARAVDTLLHHHQMRIPNISVATAVFQVAWGAIFAALFGMTPGVLRVSTLVLSVLGGAGTYGLCRELGLRPGPAALSAAAVLFAPLAYVLEFSFMSDAQFTALLMLSTFMYVRGERRALRWCTLGGSALAALAFLVRQQGVLIPVAVLTWLVVRGGLRPNRAGLRVVALVAGIPALVCLTYVGWVTFIHGVPAAQHNLFGEIGRAGWRGMVDITIHMVFVEAMYVGLFALPVCVAAVVGPWRSLLSRSWRAWAAGTAWAAVVVAGLVVFSGSHRYMPYVPQFLATWGLGPSDLQGDRSPIVGDTFRQWLTGVTALSAVVFGYLIAHRFLGGPSEERPQRGGGAGGMVLAVVAWQAAGAIPPSLHYRVPGPAAVFALSLDRYLLPLLPLVVCLALWGLGTWRGPKLWPAWMVTAAFAVVAVVGTRDYLVFQHKVQSLASELDRSGIPNVAIDAGAQRNGEQLYVNRPDIPPPLPGRPWWVNFFAPETDPVYVIATKPQPGYDEVRSEPYSEWLSARPNRLFVLRRSDAGPVQDPRPPG